MRCANCGHKVKRYHGKWYHSHGYLVQNLTPKCPICDCRTPYFFTKHSVIKPFVKGSLERFIFNLNKIKYNLNKKPYYNHFSSNRFFNNLVWMVILSLTFAVLYYNIDNINLFLKGFPLGNILLLINGIFWVKYTYQMLKGVVYWYKDQRNWVKYLIVLIILSLAWQSSNPNELHKNDLSTKFNFSLDNFNSSKIFYIPSELKTVFYISPEQKNESKESFAYLNQLRKQNNRRPIEWDDKIYELSVARSKDMYERNYFDHTTPEGKCVKDFKSSYGLDRYTIAENLGAQYVGYNERDMSISKTIDIKGQIDGWMESRGHRYNLMYPDHVKGAIGCYYGVCAFLGANTDPYGLGAGPCTTGDEGIAYWKSVGKQPDEI